MADNNKENRMSIDDFDFAHENANDDTSMLVNYLVTRLHQAMGNPALQGEVQQRLHAYGILPPIQQERGLERFQGETSKRGLSTEKGVENPYQELKQLLEGKPSSKKKGHAQHKRSPSREREISELSDESMEDVAPRQRRAQRSPTHTKRKRSPHSPHRRESKRKEKNFKKKKERKRSPSSPSSSPSSSSDEGSGYSSQERQRRGHRRSYAAWKRSSKLKKFKEGGKNISFLTYDGTFGATDKVLAFIQQIDAAFEDEGFTETSKLCHVAMHFQKSARQWWASLRGNGEAPKTWKALRASIMKQFLESDAKDKVLTKWRSLKLSPYESIHKYVDKFWDLHLKATVYKKIDFEEQKQQFCAGLPEDMNEYVNSQRPRSISTVIHHTMVAARINFQQGSKRNLKPMEAKEKLEYKGKNFSQNSSKGNSNNNKAKEKGVFKGKNRLTSKELERYHKENKCFKCGEQGHSYRSCSQRNLRNEQPRASMVEAPKEEVHCKGSPLSYAWGKVREHDAFILFDPGSTHNFISLELATKLGVQDFEMGDAMKADGAFINQEVSFTPLIGKLRLHIQGYVNKEDFFISPLKHEDVILGAPWFDRLAASIKFPERKISFKFKEKYMYINAQESGSSIPLVNDQAFDKSIKSSVSAYMIFVKDSLNGVDETQVNENGMQVDLELSNFLNQFQDVFIDDIPGELPPKRGDDDHMIELIPGSSPPNKPPYRVSQAQQDEIMRQVNELVEKGMVRPSSSPICSPVLLVQKKDGTYPMCVDYRAPNRITIKNRFLVPRVEDLFDKLRGSTYFSRIDLKSGYHQIRIVDEDIIKTAFHTTFGLYEYLVMPFGLTNAPATFNRMMERIFRPHRNFTGVFFDDVIIYSKTIEEHKEHLKGPKITWPQLLHLAPKVRRQWTKLLSTRCVKTKAMGLVSGRNSQDITPVLDAYVKGQRVSNVHLDGGAQICVMTKQTMHCLGLKINAPTPCKAKKIKVCEIEVEVDVYVMTTKGEGYPIILGRPWIMAMQARQDWGTGMLKLQPHKGTKKGKAIHIDLKDGKHESLDLDTSVDKFRSFDYSTSEEELIVTDESDSSQAKIMGVVLTNPTIVNSTNVLQVEKGFCIDNYNQITRVSMVQHINNHQVMAQVFAIFEKFSFNEFVNVTMEGSLSLVLSIGLCFHMFQSG
ncbi:hypothetical protein L7F22_018129 [Adiantum nelumboides]|nr:hypothetical protein [Adiantum nelumboides]